MRITKKFTGDASIGKKVFHPVVRDDPKVLKEVEDSQAKLACLYQKWKQRLESQEHEMARKSMAAAAVSVASTLCDNPHLPVFSTVSPSSRLIRGVKFMRMTPEMMSMVSKNKLNIHSDKAKKDITQTATWLERAEMLLSNKSTTESSQRQREIEEEMKEISRLITEGSGEILTISADLPNILNAEPKKSPQAPIHKLHSCPDLRILCSETELRHSEQLVSTPTAGKRKRLLSDDESIPDSPNNPMKLLASLSSQAAPVPIDSNHNAKRAASSSNSNESEAVPNNNVDAEDAKTFVNFLQSVVHVRK